MKLIGNSSSFEIQILNRTNPNTSDKSDIKWVQVELKIILDGFRSHQFIELYDEDFFRFYQSLKDFLNDFSLPIIFNTLEESIFLKGVMDKTGQVYWEGYTIYPIGNGNKLSFKFQTELAQIDSLTLSLKRELSEIGTS